MVCINDKATPTNDTNYSYHIKAVKLIYLILWDGTYITPLVTNRLGDGHTHACTHAHTHTHMHMTSKDKSNFKKPDVQQQHAWFNKSVHMHLFIHPRLFQSYIDAYCVWYMNHLTDIYIYTRLRSAVM